MINKSNPAVAEKEVGYDLINNDNSVVSAITSSYIKDGNLIIHISNPNNEKIQIIGLEGKKYKIKPDKVIIYDYKGEQFKLKIGSHSDIYEFGNWIIEGDKVYVDNSSWGRLEAYPHTIHSSGWVYFNVTVYKDFGDLDFLWGFNTTEVKPTKAEFYKPHFVNWTTNHSAFFYNVSSISVTDEPCNYGNEYNSYKRKITYQVCSQWNETTWECEKYNTTSAVVCFDSYEQNGTNYTAFWHTNHSRLEDWLNIGKYLNHTEYNYDGMDKWWYIKNFEIEPNKTYTARAYVKVPVTTEGTSGKYYFAVKRSVETLSEAISSGHFMVLDPWWNASWSRKRAIHINNTGNSNALTDYQVMLNITYDSDMNSNFSDIRVVNDTSGETVPYWIENKSDGSWCKIWFNASYIPASSWCNDTYYLYYGNPSASSASDGDSVFEFFDDFNGDLSKWTTGGTWSIVDGKAKHEKSTGTWDYLKATAPVTDGIFEARLGNLKDDGSTHHELGMFVRGDDTSSDYCIQNIIRIEDGDLYYNDWGSYQTVSITTAYNTYYRQTFIVHGEDVEVKWDGVTKITDTTSHTTETLMGFRAVQSESYIDWLLIRKYASPEPTAELGSEEQQDTDTTFTVTLPAGYTYAHFNLTGIAGGIAHDTSGNGNDGTIYGAKWTDGKFGSALSFDGVDDYVDCGNDASLNITDEITIEAWVNAKTFAGSGIYRGIVVKKEDIYYISNGYALVLGSPDNLWIFVVGDGSNDYRATAPAETDKWVHLVGVKDSNKIYLYVNGEEHIGDSNPVLGPTTNPVEIGKWTGQECFHGTIDEVRIYNRALNETEIQNNYNGSITRNGLVGEWTFDYGPSSQQNVTPEGQSYNQPFYNITNTGNVNLTVKMKINATIPNVILKADTDNNPSGAKEINTTYAVLCEDLPPNEYLNVWLWTDLSHAAEQETEKELEINVST